LTFAALKTTCTRLIMHLRPGRAADVMQRLHTYAPCSDSCLRQMNSAWTEIVSGRRAKSNEGCWL
jgi:hypothetical protein